MLIRTVSVNRGTCNTCRIGLLGKGRLPSLVGMAQLDRTPFHWGSRFRRLAKSRNVNLAKVAERLELSESSVRHWTNGTRPIKLADFLRLCKAAGLDAAMVLFAESADPHLVELLRAWDVANELQRRVLLTAAQGVLAQHDEAARRPETGQALPGRGRPYPRLP